MDKAEKSPLEPSMTRLQDSMERVKRFSVIFIIIVIDRRGR